MRARADSRAYRSIRALGGNAPHTRRNHVLGILAGTFGETAQDFLHPELILAGLVYALTESPVLVALVTIVSKAGVLAPQLLASGFIEHTPRRRPYFVFMTAARTLALAALVASIWLLTWRTDALTLTLFYAAYLAACICLGAAHVIFMDMVGRLIPSHRVGSFLGMRTFLGGGAAILSAAVVIQPILLRLPLPANYAVLVGIGALLALASMSTWSLCREEAGPKASRPTTFVESLRRGMRWLRTDWNYRCFLWQRVAFRVSYLALAFFIPFGSRRLGYDARAGGLGVLGGILVATLKLSSVAASAVWGRIADRTSSRRILIAAGAFLLLAPALALAAPYLPRAFELPIPYLRRGLDLPLCVYLLALACIGIGTRGTVIGGNRFLITSAPLHRRGSYVAFLNTVTSPLTLLPLAGAYLAKTAGMNVLFAAIALGGVLAVVGAWRMRPAAGDRPPA